MAKTVKKGGGGVIRVLKAPHLSPTIIFFVSVEKFTFFWILHVKGMTRYNRPYF